MLSVLMLCNTNFAELNNRRSILIKSQHPKLQSGSLFNTDFLKRIDLFIKSIEPESTIIQFKPKKYEDEKH